MADSHEMQTSVDSAVDSVNAEIGEFLVFSATFNHLPHNQCDQIGRFIALWATF